MPYLRKLFWIVLFLFSTLCFVTLFEVGWHGPDDFVKNLKIQFKAAMNFSSSKIEREKDKSDKIGQ